MVSVRRVSLFRLYPRVGWKSIPSRAECFVPEYRQGRCPARATGTLNIRFESCVSHMLRFEDVDIVLFALYRSLLPMCQRRQKLTHGVGAASSFADVVAVDGGADCIARAWHATNMSRRSTQYDRTVRLPSMVEAAHRRR